MMWKIGPLVDRKYSRLAGKYRDLPARREAGYEDFCEEVFARIYATPKADLEGDRAFEWAHNILEKILQDVRQECRGRADLSWVATREFLQELPPTPPESKDDEDFIVYSMKKDIQEKIEDIQEVERSLGINPGSLSNRDFQDENLGKIESLARLLDQNPKIRKSMEMIGRMLGSIQTSVANTTKGNTEVHSLEYGDSLSRMLATEYIQANSSAGAKALWAVKYADKACSQYSLRRVPQTGLGPAAFLMDASGSMKEDECDIKAKAMILALCRFWQKKGVACRIGMFDTALLFEGEYTLDNVYKLLRKECLGGTNFNVIAETEIPENYDLVVLTDGYADFRQNTVNWMKKLGRVFVVAFDLYCLESFQVLTNGGVEVHLFDANKPEQMFRKLVRKT